MTNPYYGPGSAVSPFVLADARDLINEFAAIELGFDAVAAALTENRLASTSTTSLAIGTGSKTLLIEAGRAFSIGQFISIARTSDPTNFMSGQITSYNAGSGVLVVNATEVGGSGTYSAWTVALSIPGATANFVRKTGDTMSGPLVLSADPAAANEAARKAYVDAVVTAAAILAKLLTVDGSGSGLDADLLDGLNSSAFALLSGANFSGSIGTSGNVTSTNGTGSAYLTPSGDMTANRGNGEGALFLGGSAARALYYNGTDYYLTGASLYVNNGFAWTANNDGSGSSLDADLLDGYDGAAYWRSNMDTFSSRSSVSNGYLQINPGNATNPGYVSFHTADSTRRGFVGWHNGSSRLVIASDGGWAWAFDQTPVVGGSSMWHAGNDGAGSGLDADLLDGLDSAYFVNIPARLGYTPLNQTSYTAADVLAKLLTVDGAGSGIDADLLDGSDSAFYTNIPARLGYTPLNQTSYTAADVLAKIITVDGAGSGLDADMLDGLDSTAFARLSQSVASADLADAIGYKGLPVNAKTGGYTILASDGGKVIPNTTGGFVVPTGLPQGFSVALYNDSGSPQSITSGGDTLRLAVAGTTGSRTVAGYSMATLVKVKSGEWLVQGGGVT